MSPNNVPGLGQLNVRIDVPNVRGSTRRFCVTCGVLLLDNVYLDTLGVSRHISVNPPAFVCDNCGQKGPT